ncbi:MAG: hypothetical protein OEY14_14765, partial [Myxococcales bacterium]|nr:hypothetical protein [Myxococcales bacterium]
SAPAGRFAVCVPPPLAGDGACGDGPRFLHSSVDIKSTQPLEQVLGTLGQTLGYTAGTSRGGEPWAAFLRPEATKTIVVVSDDDSRLVADQFEHFAGGSNPWNSTELPPGILEPTWASLFDGYTFDAIYGYGSETDPSVICTYPGGSSPPKPGLTYTELVTRTGGVRAQICDGAAAWGPFFEAIATTVASTARVDCEVALPPPPAGMELDPALVNVVLGGASSTTLFKVAGPTACGPEGGWYYDDELSPTLVSLCPSSCEMAQAQLQTEGSASMEIRFGCATLLI